MNREQLIQAMSLMTFELNVHYAMDQDYESIAMLDDLIKPLQEELDFAVASENLSNAQAALSEAQASLNALENPTQEEIDTAQQAVDNAQESVDSAQEESNSAELLKDAALAIRTENERKSAVQTRLNGLGDLSLIIGKYIQGNQESITDSDSFNIEGFSDVNLFESSFGWNFVHLAKPTIDQLEALVPDSEAEILEQQFTSLRRERDRLLKESDFTQLADAPFNSEKKSEWAVYRQALRDLPENTEDPLNPTWPTEPV